MKHRHTAAAARQSLDLFAQLTDPAQSPEEAAETLIATVGHYCRNNHIGFLSVLKRGIGRWYAEREKGHSTAPLPHVSIQIQ